MAISARIFVIVLVVSYYFISASCILGGSRKQKRQLFREHIAPELGGRIPDSTFQAERISLNRLNQNGFFTHDGLHLQHRAPNNHPFPKQAFPSTYKIFMQMDNSNVAPAGQSFHIEEVDTSYLKSQPVHFIIIPNLQYSPYPLVPKHSLDLFYQSKKNEHSSYGDIDEFQVLKEFAPYLEKLHLDD